MSTRLRHKGRFVKEHIVAGKAKRVAALQAASRKRAQKARESLVAEKPGSFRERYRFEGRRIVDMQEFAKNLECHLCKRRLDIVNTVCLYKFVCVKKRNINREKIEKREREREFLSFV